MVAPSLAEGTGYVRDKARSAMARGGEQLAPFCENPRRTFVNWPVGLSAALTKGGRTFHF
ncbi:MAG: hypothetical protein CML03_11505 [Pseudooceanicola sp.]|nr:hypothetical protein [Pseudooceanicola sp.]